MWDFGANDFTFPHDINKIMTFIADNSNNRTVNQCMNEISAAKLFHEYKQHVWPNVLNSFSLGIWLWGKFDETLQNTSFNDGFQLQIVEQCN